jgi:hypothetical protein
MANVVRLVNGGTIQVKTGVLQGVGPQGPRGYVGPQGPQGEQGPVGEQGQIGQILQQATRTTVGSSNPIGANTDTMVTFGVTGGYDELNAIKSQTNVGFDAAGDYMLSVWLQLNDAASGYRDIWFQTGSTIIARSSRSATAGSACYVDLTHTYRAAVNDIVSVFVRSSAATAVAIGGSWTITRVGSGPPGIQGIQGIQGLQGVKGDQGVAGPSGTANSGFTKYSDLLPH